MSTACRCGRTSLSLASHFSLTLTYSQAWELSLEVCLEAGHLPETLKCVQTLAHHIYPDIAAREGQDVEADWASSMAVLLLCHALLSAASKSSLAVVSTLKACPRQLLTQRDMQSALRALRLLANRDCLGLLALRETLPRKQRVLLRAQLAEMRAQALWALGSSYRNISCHAAARWLDCPPASLPAVLKVLADR